MPPCCLRPKPSARRWRARPNVRKTPIRRILWPGWPGSLPDLVAGIATINHPAPRQCGPGGDNSKAWPQVLLSPRPLDLSQISESRRATILEPGVFRAVDLHQFAQAFTPPPRLVRRGLAVTAVDPQAVRHHPLSQRLDAEAQAVTRSTSCPTI